DVIDGKLIRQVVLQLSFILQLIGLCGANPDVRLSDNRKADLINELSRFLFVSAHATASGMQPGFPKDALHLGLALDLLNLIELQSCNIEIGAELGFGFQPILILRVDAVQLAEVMRKIA